MKPKRIRALITHLQGERALAIKRGLPMSCTAAFPFAPCFDTAGCAPNQLFTGSLTIRDVIGRYCCRCS